MTILVTGAGGQVGRELIQRAKGLPVVGFDHATLDIADPEAVSSAVAKHAPRCVINAAAYTAVDRAEGERDRAFEVNSDGPANLAGACALAGIPLLHLSTDYVFDGTDSGSYKPNSPASPLGIYGASKWAGEEAVRKANLRHLILRVSWVFGAFGNNFVRTMLRLGRERTELRVVADQFGAPTHAGAIAESLLHLAARCESGESLQWGTWHYTGMPVTTWYGFAQEVFASAIELGMIDRAPVVHPITTAEFPTPAKRPANSRLDCSQTTDALGISPRAWQEGLRETLLEMGRAAKA